MNDRVDLNTDLSTELDRFAPVPDEVLWQIVTRDGSCMGLEGLGPEPVWTGNNLTDRELAARICAGCPVRWQCLELELRTCGDHPWGVWGALPPDDIRAVYPTWLARRQRRDGGPR